MWIHHVKITLRNIIRHKGYAFLNIFGLAAGMTCCILIGLWVLDELSYDRFHENASSICRVESNQNFSGRILHIYWTPHPLGPALKAEIPEIKDSTRAENLSAQLIRYKDKAFEEYAVWSVDPSFLKMFTFPMTKGDPENALSGTSSLVMTERVAAKFFGDENPIGKSFSFWDQKGKIVGVIKDFHFQPLRRQIEPLVIQWAELEWTNFLFLRIAPEGIAETIGSVQGTWEKILPNIPFSYQFLDEDFARMYRSEERTGTLLKIFTAMAILVACLGLFGLASFAAEQRTKEIGIRKVLGASVPGIVALMCREFLVLIGLANLIAWPVAYFAVNDWLNNFAYRTSVPALVFLGALIISLAIGLMTVIYKAIRAASANPVAALKHE